MNAVPYDVWSGVATTSWDFGDFAVNAATTSPPAFGGTQTYPAAHTYAHAGTYSVMVKITDGVGHTTFDARLITIAPAPPAAVVKPSAGTTTQAEALLAGTKITIAALMKRTPRAKRCPTKATATVKLKVSSRITITGRAKLKVKATKVNGQARCRATGTLKLSGAPATTAKVRVVIRGTGLKARTLTAAR